MERTPPILESEIAAKVLEGWQPAEGPMKPSGNWASRAGHPCARYLVYGRTAYEQATPKTPHLIRLFDIGRSVQDQAERELRKAGFEVVEREARLEDKSLEVSGKVDFKIEIARVRYPVEVKGFNHYTWEGLKSMADLLGHRKPWVRMAPAQGLLYAWATSVPWVLFDLKSKLTGEPTYIWAHWEDHLDYLNAVMERLKLVNACVKDGSTPDPIEYDPDLCDRCEFLTLCGVERKAGADLSLEDNEELEGALERRAASAADHKAYEAAKDTIKRIVAQRPKVLCGDWLIEGKEVSKKGYAVAERVEWHTKIISLKPKAILTEDEAA